jgi:hypothetical protein
MKTKGSLVYYVAGCYGTFVEWLVNYLEGTTDALPFNNSGSSHNFKGNPYLIGDSVLDYVSSDQSNKFSRCHPLIFKKNVNEIEYAYTDDYGTLLQKDIVFLAQHFEKILCLGFDHTSLLAAENNRLEKVKITSTTRKNLESYGYSNRFIEIYETPDIVERIKRAIDAEVAHSEMSGFGIKNLLGWNKTSIFDFEIYELRELLALKWFAGCEGQIQAWKTLPDLKLPNVKFLNIDHLRDDFSTTVNSIIEFFDLKVNNDRLKTLPAIYEQWVSLQNQLDKDKICNEIVDAIESNTDKDWADIKLSIVDEAWIQKKLLDRWIGIKCYNLNTFPTNSKDFQPLLESIPQITL